MGKATQYSTSAFTTDKLKKFGVSGHKPGDKHGDGGDDYGKRAAELSDSSSFAVGGAAKAPSLGRAGRAKGGRINRPAVASSELQFSKTGGQAPGKIPDNEGGKARNLSMLTDGGPRSYGDRPLIVGKGDQNANRAKGGKVSRAKGGRIGRESGGATAQQRFTNRTQYDTGTNYLHDYVPAIHAFAKEDADELGIGSDAQGMSDRAKGGRVGRAHGGKTKSAKGKTVVNVIVGGDKGQDQPPPHPMLPPMQPPPPPPPPQAATGPRPPMPPMPGAPGAPGAAGPPGPPPPPGMPPGMPPPGMGRARGGRVSEKFGAGSGQGRMEKARRENHGKVKLGR